MSHWMFNCKDISKKVSESMDRSLTLHHRILIKMHLMMCKYCSRFRKQLLIIRDACRLENLHTKDLENTQSLSQEARERLNLLLSRQISGK
jgi:hypothetical protein